LGGSYGAGVPPPPFSENKETEIQHRLAPKPIKRPPGKDLTKSKLGEYVSNIAPSCENQISNPGTTPITFMGKMINAFIKGGVTFIKLAY
jgi:hypothetical protein